MKYLAVLVVPYLVIMGIFLMGAKSPQPKYVPLSDIGETIIHSNSASTTPSSDHSKKVASIIKNFDSETQASRKALDEFNKRFKISPTPDTLGFADTIEPSTSNQQLETTPQPTTAPHIGIGELTENPVKTTYTIAFLGDSMTDTLNPYMSTFTTLLKQKYPKYSFAILNFGQGSTDLENGIKRLSTGSTYNGKYMSSVLSYRPDILIVESFAFNSWSNSSSDLDRQWLDFAKMYTTIKQSSSDTKVLFATTIGPNSSKFGDGKLNWTVTQKKEKTTTIKAYLTNLIRFTESQHLPLADTFSKSVDSSGNGVLANISSTDYIHPSAKGAQLYFETVFEKIVSEKMIPE